MFRQIDYFKQNERTLQRLLVENSFFRYIYVLEHRASTAQQRRCRLSLQPALGRGELPARMRTRAHSPFCLVQMLGVRSVLHPVLLHLLQGRSAATEIRYAVFMCRKLAVKCQTGVARGGHGGMSTLSGNFFCQILCFCSTNFDFSNGCPPSQVFDPVSGNPGYAPAVRGAPELRWRPLYSHPVGV